MDATQYQDSKPDWICVYAAALDSVADLDTVRSLAAKPVPPARSPCTPAGWRDTLAVAATSKLGDSGMEASRQAAGGGPADAAVDTREITGRRGRKAAPR